MHLLSFILAALAASGALAVPVENVSEPSSTTSVTSDSVTGGYPFKPWQTTTIPSTHTVVSRGLIRTHVRRESVGSSGSASSTSAGTASSSTPTLWGASPIIVSGPESSTTPPASPGSTDIISAHGLKSRLRSTLQFPGGPAGGLRFARASSTASHSTHAGPPLLVPPPIPASSSGESTTVPTIGTWSAHFGHGPVIHSNLGSTSATSIPSTPAPYRTTLIPPPLATSSTAL